MLRTITVSCVVLLVVGCVGHSGAATDGKATVVRVIDGDTIVARIGGHDENVRVLGIDTPKTPRTHVGEALVLWAEFYSENVSC